MVPPSIARLKIVTRPGGLDQFAPIPPGSRSARSILASTPGGRAYLALDGADRSLKFLNPGSPIVNSNGSRDAIVWVLDANLFRSVSLIGPATPAPGALRDQWGDTGADLAQHGGSA